jgi:transaldolase/glucose-6-phosphate isomerase
MKDKVEELTTLSNKIRNEGIEHIILLGMGGSSLAPEVFQESFSTKNKSKLIVLDSTHPSYIKSVEQKIELKKSLFIISSKSGTTIETLSLFRYFSKKIQVNNLDPSQHFIVITDQDTPLMKHAKESKVKHIFKSPIDVGGRYSALTEFGLVPAALIGVDIDKILDRAWDMSENCSYCVSAKDTSGLILGASIGELAKMGRDKITFLTSKSLRSFPNWIEQLVAESTGEEGKGIRPIVNEPISKSTFYDSDRFFVYIFRIGEIDEVIEELLDSLEKAGHPTIRISLDDIYDLGREIFCWEISVAAAGSILKIHPFNQPNVEMSKKLAEEQIKKITTEIQKNETIDEINVDNEEELIENLKSFLNSINEKDYFAIQAYLKPSNNTNKKIQELRKIILEQKKIATTIGYGPRFLHSTGQLHKGGPNIGLFLQFIDEPAEDLKIPDTSYTFGSLIKAQSQGDYYALKQLNRTVIRINLKNDINSGLSKIIKLVNEINASSD